SGIWGHGNSVWFLGPNHFVWRDINGILNPDGALSGFGSGPVKAIWGVSENEIYAVDSASGIWKRDGTGTWSSEPDAAQFTGFLGIWGDSTTGDLITAGALGTVTVRTSGTWTGLSSPTTEKLVAVWGCSATEAWLAGTNGTLLHRGHDTLTVVSLGTGNDL